MFMEAVRGDAAAFITEDRKLYGLSDPHPKRRLGLWVVG